MRNLGWDNDKSHLRCLVGDLIMKNGVSNDPCAALSHLFKVSDYFEFMKAHDNEKDRAIDKKLRLLNSEQHFLTMWKAMEALNVEQS